jgi:signal transduction histidine kinase
MSFRRRLALFLIVTLASVQLLTALLGYAFLRDGLVKKGEREMLAESMVFTRQLDLLSERMSDGVQVLSLDYALRQAIAQNDYETQLSALRNHGHRIGATRMLLVGLDGKIAADTGAAHQNGTVFNYPRLLEVAASGEQAKALATLGNQVYWIVIAPVRAPVPIAFIAACIPVDGKLLAKLQAISYEQRSIALATRDASGKWIVVAQSGAHSVNPLLLRAPGTASPMAEVKSVGGHDFLAVTAPLKTAMHSAPIFAILDYPLDEMLAPYRAVAVPLLFVSLGVLALALLGAMLMVRSFSRPLEMLAGAARRIAAGDYTPPARLKQRDEIGHLGDALINMTRSIAEREAALTSAIGALEVARSAAVRANEAKSQFLANMSHELRTPLNAIVGFSEMLHGEVLGPISNKRYIEYAHDICNSGQHLLSLVATMLDLADFESGNMNLDKKRISLAELAQNCVTVIRPFAEKSGVELVVDGDLAHLPEIDGDSVKLGQAITGILHNAVKFTPAGGEIHIRVGGSDAQVKLRIEDSGIGMREEDISVVLKPFHRLRSALDGQHQGTGLGLPFAKAIIDQHGGVLNIESEFGHGTAVEIALPLIAKKLERAA